MTFFYKKKRNTPEMGDLIMYKSINQLKKYEWIDGNKAAKERKEWIIRDAYFLQERKWEFWYYIKGYVRFDNPDLTQRTTDALRKKAKYIGREKNFKWKKFQWKY